MKTLNNNATKQEIINHVEELESKMLKLFAYTKKLKEDNETLKKSSILHDIITEQGCKWYSIKNYIQNELTVLCHFNQNVATLAMSRTDEFYLLFLTVQYSINSYCDYLNITEDKENGVYKIELLEDKMTDKLKQFFNMNKECNFTTSSQMLQSIKAAELQEIESILQSYGYSLATINE